MNFAKSVKAEEKQNPSNLVISNSIEILKGIIKVAKKLI
jgi:hypothetical protein